MSTKKSPKQIIALVISVAVHAAIIFYLGKMALEYALPEGTVSSYEISYDSPQGTQVENVNVDVVETPPPAPKPVEKPKMIPVPVVKSTPAPAKPTATLPEKAPSEEVPVEADAVGSVPVPVDVPESTTPATDPIVSETDEKVLDQAVEEPAEIAPLPTDPIPSGADTSNQNYGRPEGVQSDTVLSPLAGNKKISYPTMARFRKLEGETIVHYTVSPEGAVTDVTLVQSSGHSVLDDSVIETVKDWKFNATGKSGVYERPVKFSLKGDATPAPSRLRRPNP